MNHALLDLGARHAGIPVAPISPAYTLASRAHVKLKAIANLLQPGLVYTDEPERFAPALKAIGATSPATAADRYRNAGP